MSEKKEKVWIGDKKIGSTSTLKEKTPAGYDLIEVIFTNGTTAIFSKMMFDAIVSVESCDDSALRDKRVHPVVGSVLAIMREWGIKVGETQYFSALVTQSLNSNKDEAEKQLWKGWAPTIKSLDDVDLILIDRVLKTIKPEEKPVPSPKEFYDNEDGKKAK